MATDPNQEVPPPKPEVHWSPATINPSRKAALLRVLFESEDPTDGERAS